MVWHSTVVIFLSLILKEMLLELNFGWGPNPPKGFTPELTLVVEAVVT